MYFDKNTANQEITLLLVMMLMSKRMRVSVAYWVE